MNKNILSKIYIDKAVDIRKRYKQEIMDLALRESELEKAKESLNKTINSVVGFDKTKNTKMTEKDFDFLMKKRTGKIDKEINTLTRMIEPMIINIEKLEVESMELFEMITDKYEGITPEEIKEQIIPYLIEI